MATPDWDMTPYFSALGAPDYEEFGKALARDTARLAGELAGGLSVDTVLALEQLGARVGHLRSYLGCLGAADSTDARCKRDTAALAALGADLDKLEVALRAHLVALTPAAWSALLGDPRLADTGYYLERQRQRAAWAMAPELEGLAAELGVTGLSAWGRLYQQVSGTLELSLEVPGRAPVRHPVAMTRTLLEDGDRAVRQAAFAGAARAWEGVAETTSAALNAISGTRLALYRRRGIGHFLEPALFDAGIDRRTLDTMLGVVRERQEVARRYLRRKAARLGLARLGACDLMAPLPGRGEARITWPEGRARVLAAFTAAYPALAEFADHAFTRRWIDHTPRPGKRPGGFCSSSALLGESRIFMTYGGAAGDVQTLAHELGHAFHNWLLRDARPFARRYPMTLAETASTFAENWVLHAALADPATTAAERLAIRDTRLQDVEVFLLNIPMRFDFEHALYQARGKGELGVGELKELMLTAQRDNYGDALDPALLDPWFWASKLHFFITDVSFYNFPYTFGYLLSTGLFARALDHGKAFLPRYEAFLRRAGRAPAEVVARETLGLELASPAFWHESIDFLERELVAYEAA